MGDGLLARRVSAVHHTGVLFDVLVERRRVSVGIGRVFLAVK